MKRLVTYLLAAFAVVCVGIAFIVSPVEAPQSNSKATKLAYEISTSERAASNAPVDDEADKSDLPDEAATTEANAAAEPDTTAAVAPEKQGWAPTVNDDRPETAATDPADTEAAAVDPQDQVPPAGDPSLPWSGQHPQASGQPEAYGAGQPQDHEAQQPEPYEQGPQGYDAQGQPQQGYDAQGQNPQGYEAQGQYPQGQYPPNQYPEGQNPQGQSPQGQYPEGQNPQGQAWNGQAQPGQEDGQQQAQEQWVRLVGSASMHSNPNDESAMLFAFPAGRTLRVVSQTEGWVEVTDPQSAATGWIRTDYVQGSYAPGQQQAYQEPVYDEPQQRQGRGWFRRNTGGLTDMIERAFSGY